MRRQLTLKDPYLGGDDIKEVQQALGFKAKAVDGDYGPDTAGAVEEWKWRVGYPKRQINDRLGLLGLAWLFGEVPFPPHFAPNARKRKGKPFASATGIARPLSTSPVQQRVRARRRRGAPDRKGVKHHAGKDWFAPGKSPVRAPVAGVIIEALVRPTTTGQVFGGCVIEATRGKVSSSVTAIRPRFASGRRWRQARSSRV